MTDWTNDIKQLGESRHWKPLPKRRALKLLADTTGTEQQHGVAADRGLRLAYNALAKATPEQRAACQDWEGCKELQHTLEADEAAKRQAIRDELRAEFDAMADQDGWTLLAGEDTTLVANGTRHHCMDNLYRVRHCGRDQGSGRGCWVLIAPDGREAANGTFTADMVL